MTSPIEMYSFECLLHSFTRRNACLAQIACKSVPPCWLTWGGMKPPQTRAAIWAEIPLKLKLQEVCASGDCSMQIQHYVPFGRGLSVCSSILAMLTSNVNARLKLSAGLALLSPELYRFSAGNGSLAQTSPSWCQNLLHWRENGGEKRILLSSGKIH